MAEIGTVIAPSIGPNRDQTTPVRLVSCMMSSEEDIQTVQLAGSIDCAPPPGTQVLVVDVGQSYKIGIVLDDKVLPSAVSGEQWIYASLGGSTLCTVKCKVDGSIEILGLLGWITINGITGQVNINDNLTVESL